MTTNEAKYLTHAEAAKAKAEGKDVQCRHKSGCEHWWLMPWEVLDRPNDEYLFRLAPPAPRVAREWWINNYGYSLCTFLSANEAEKFASAGRKELIHVREVIPGEPTVREAVRDALERAEKIARDNVWPHVAGNCIATLRRELCGE